MQDTDSEKYNTELNELNNLLGVDNEKITADYLFYDIYFTSESAGGRIEPATGTVKVQMQYATPQLEKNTDDESCQSTLKVYVNRKEDTTAEFEKNETDAVKSVKFKTFEMGVVALTRVTTVLAEERTITYQDDEKTIVAVVSDSKALPEDATLVVNEVQLSDEQKELAENSLDSSEQMNDYTAYDMHFEKDGVEVEPQNATVTVSIQFNEVKEIGDETVNQEASKIQVLHLDDDSNVSDVTKDVAVDEEGNVKSAEFVTDNFSIFILAQTVENNRKFVYEDDNVKITAVADKKEEVLNSNLVRMRVEILDDPNSEEYKKIEEVLKEEYKKDNKVLLGFRYYDFTFLKGEEEVEPTEKVKISIERKNTQLPESIPEGLVNDVEIYHVSDNDDTISAEKLSAKIEDNNKNAMVKGNFQMDSFSGVTETYGANGTSMSRSQIVSDLGIAQNFAVFAINFTNDNHMEGAIAVKNLNGNTNSLGNTDAVYQNTTKFDLVIKKKTSGSAGKNTTFKFGIYTKDNSGYQVVPGLDNIQITTNDKGEGISDTIDSSNFNTNQKYYVFEIDDSGNPITSSKGTINGREYDVSYSTNGLKGSSVQSVGNTSYIEFFKQPGGANNDLVQSNNGIKASVIMGSTNTVQWINPNQGYIVGQDQSKYQIESSKVDVIKADEPFPIDFESQLNNLENLSSKLGNLVPNEMDDVKVAYVPISDSGKIDYENIFVDGKKPFKYVHEWTANTGLQTDGKLLVINVDCTNAPSEIDIEGCKVNDKGPGAWDPIANSVIWNFYTNNNGSISTYTGHIKYSNGLGTLLAPTAHITCVASTNGSVIANTVDHAPCEIHHIKPSGSTTVLQETVTCSNASSNDTEDKGDLSISKKVEGASTGEKTFKFTVKGPDGKYYDQDGTASDTEAVLLLKAGETITIQDLPVGEYTVSEKTDEAGIEGYGLTVTGTGKVTIRKDSQAIAAVTNTYTKTSVDVKISKVDAETYKVLGGAHLMVIDPDGNVVDEWDSTKNAHKITGLKPGVTYTLRETKAPKGYDVAADTTFELNEDGTINTANTTTSISGDDLLVKDEKTVDKTVSVSVTKRLVTVDGQVIGAPDATYYVALYSDPDCTQRVSDVMALNYKNASVSTVTFTGLKKDQTYYVGECEADGTSYLANVNADGTLYTVDFSDGNTVEITNNDGSKTIYFDNQFEKVPDGYYKEGELNITKKLVGGDGKAKNSSEIFYAGIFSDADFTQLSPDVSDNIVPLDLAGGSEVTSQVKVSIPEGGSITLYVTEVDSEGNPVAGAAVFFKRRKK